MSNYINSLYKKFLAYPAISTDTRSIKTDSIFFALKGENFNGNNYAVQALEQGCKYAVIDEQIKGSENNEQLILVENVLETLQELASFHRKNLKTIIIGITGSNGKTTTKELVNAVLQRKYKTLATTGNLNNHIGVPLTLFSIRPEVEIAIIEMGANHQGEIALLSEIAQPDYGLISNIGKAHLEGFGGLEGIKKGKGELFEYIRNTNGKVFVNTGSRDLTQMSEGLDAITYGISENNDICGKILDVDPFVKLTWTTKEERRFKIETEAINSALIGRYNFDNILAAVCIGNYFKVAGKDIKEAIENYIPSNNRSQIVKTKNNTIWLDAYNANPSSMEAAIINFSELQEQDKMLVLGDMLELGNDTAKEHQFIADLVTQTGFNAVYFVGKHFAETSNAFKCFDSVEQCYDFIKEEEIAGKTILVKGSRGIKLEKIIEAL